MPSMRKHIEATCLETIRYTFLIIVSSRSVYINKNDKKINLYFLRNVGHPVKVRLCE